MGNALFRARRGNSIENRKSHVASYSGRRDNKRYSRNQRRHVLSTKAIYRGELLIGMMKTAGKSVEDEADSAILKEVEGIGTEANRAGIIETFKRIAILE